MLSVYRNLIFDLRTVDFQTFENPFKLLCKTFTFCRPDVLNYLLRASCALADNIAVVIDKQAFDCNAKEITACWQNIWFETLKAIHSRNVDGHGFLLLVSILKVSFVVSFKSYCNFQINRYIGNHH